MSGDSRIKIDAEAPDASRPAVPIRINLLPHRERKRSRRKKDFIGFVAIVAIAGVVTAFAGGVAINQLISTQEARNEFIKSENARLDKQIAEVKTLREEIAALKARQQAVENLQSDRTLPVHLLDELVKLAPEGMYLRQVRQEDMKVVMTGHAQSNERVAELLRNLAERSPWLERPELGEIKQIALPVPPGQKAAEAKRIYEFTLNALVKRQSQPSDGKAPPAPQKVTAAEPVKVGAAK